MAGNHLPESTARERPWSRRTPPRVRGADAALGASAGAPASSRLWEVDGLRTLAIAMMVAYHAGYDVDLLAPSVGIDALGGPWRALQVATGTTFLFVVGLSLAISNGRATARGMTALDRYRRHAGRAAQVGAAAAVVSLATWVALGDDWVRFGILHCIAAAMLIGPLLMPLGRANWALGALVLAAGLIIRDLPATDITPLLVVGVPPTGGAGVDWYPLLPWLAPVLFGLAAGARLYPAGRRGPWGRHLPEPAWAGLLGLPGRHALPIYLVHQPVLILLVAGALAVAGIQVSWAAFS